MKTYIWAVVGFILLILIVGFYFYWQTATPIPNTQKIITPQVQVAPPEINPIEKANPFNKTYKNPFE